MISLKVSEFNLVTSKGKYKTFKGKKRYCMIFFIYLDLLTDSNEKLGFWLGGSDIEEEGTWVWADQSPGKSRLSILF